MSTVRRFEELKIWQLARKLCQEVNRVVILPNKQSDPALCDQINRSSASVMDNIAEGFDRFSRADFRHFLTMARGSAAEVRSQLYRAVDRNLLEADLTNQLLKQAMDLSVRISNLISHLHHTEFKSKAPSQKGIQIQEAATEYLIDSSNYLLPEDEWVESNWTTP
jgi:four helix bundle protein